MNISVAPTNLNSRKINSKNSISLNTSMPTNVVSFSGFKDIFTRSTQKISEPMSKETQKEFKLLKKQASRLGVKAEKEDSAEMLKAKIAKAQKDDEVLANSGIEQPYFSWRLRAVVTDPVDKEVAKIIDNLPLGII